MTTKPWRRRNGFGPIWELPLVLVLLVSCLSVFVIQIGRAISAGLSREVAIAVGLAGAFATGVSILSIFGLLVTIAGFRSNFKRQSLGRRILTVIVCGCLATALPVYLIALRLADI